MQRSFKVILDWNSDIDVYTVTVPALPGCITEGSNIDEALANARLAINSYLKVLEKLGRAVPTSNLPPEGKLELVINTNKQALPLNS